eukprot:3116366-Alexandrium_andersonii.AAC.1
MLAERQRGTALLCFSAAQALHGLPHISLRLRPLVATWHCTACRTSACSFGLQSPECARQGSPPRLFVVPPG